METIWKYVLTDEPVQYIDVPHDHRVFSIEQQLVELQGPVTHGEYTQVCMWVFVNPASPRLRKLQVHVVGTGFVVPPIAGFDFTRTIPFAHDDVRHYFVKAL